MLLGDQVGCYYAGLVGERVDFSVRLFSPIHEAELDTSVVGASFKVNDRSERSFFVIPNFGITTQINKKVWGWYPTI